MVNSGDWNNWHPCISADGLSLYIASDRNDSWLSDIRVTTRLSRNDPWEEPVKLGINVNSHDYETTPFISPDGLSLFFSRGYDQADVHVSRRVSTTDPWGPAELFTPVNSGESEFAVSFSDDDSTIYFSRTGNPDFNIWQVEVTPIMDLNGDDVVDTLDIIELQRHWGSTDSFYDIAPLPLGDGISNDKDLRVLKEHLSLIPTDPYPISEANETSCDVVLSWNPIESAKAHDVYLGDNLDNVKDATTADSSYMGQQTVASYDPGRLEFGKTYFWRVDEVMSSVPGSSVFTGDVWSFTVEPYSIQIPGSAIAVTASSVSDEFSIPENTINGSGVDAADAHAITSETMWFSASPDLDPWIQYEFDEVMKLDVMKVWNSNRLAETVIGWGVKDVEIAYSVDGENWDVLEEAIQFSRAPGLPTYNLYDEIVFGGMAAKYVHLSIQSNWGGIVKAYGLSEVQFTMIPAQARTPEPASGSVDVLPNRIVTWRAGRQASQHVIYVSTEPEAVASGSAASVTTSADSLDLTPLDLQLGETYYWRVDEINEAETPSAWAGPVWSFSTLETLVVDNFDSYGNSSPDRPFQTWLDGSGYSADEFFPVAYGGNGTGAGIGHDIWSPSSPHYGASIMESDNTIPGSYQSMPFYYSNTGGIASQIDRNWLTPQDWSGHGIQTLVLHFYGAADNTGLLYVKIDDTRIAYDGDASNLTEPQWNAWHIDLSSRNVSRVNTLSIGVDGAGANGLILLDDIKLYK